MKLPSPDSWHLGNDYSAILGVQLKLGLAFAIANYISSRINIWALIKLKFLLSGRYFGLRSIAATLVGGLVLTLVMAFTYFYQYNLSFIYKMIISVFLIKAVYATLLSLPATAVVIYLKRREQPVEQKGCNPFTQ